MRHYKDRPFLILLNILSDFLLILFSYIAAGKIRELVGPFMKKNFGMYDMWHHFFLAVIMGIIIVFLFLVMGEYKTIHYYRLSALIFRTVMVHVIGILVGFSVLFSLRNEQLSRALLIFFFVILDVMILGKRIVASRLADELVNRKKANYRILIIGGGETAKRLYRELSSESLKRYRFSGYLADKESKSITGYLGREEDLADVLQKESVNQVIIAKDSVERLELNRMLSICSVYGIPVYMVPVFNDFMVKLNSQIFPGGLNLFELSAMKTNDILGVRIAVTNMEKTIQDIRENLDAWRGKYICVSNVHTTVMAHDDVSYRKVQNGAIMALPDGGPLSAYSRSKGSEVAKRVTGPDLMRELLERSDEYGFKHFFYGSKQETLDILADVIKEKYPGANVVGMISPPFRELTPEEDAAFVEQINAAKPDFVWVGLGAPKQEIWMAAHENRVNALMVGVGAAFDYESGNIKRAPAWMQKMSLEWLYRLLQDPKRLFKRYFITNLKYLWLTRR